MGAGYLGCSSGKVWYEVDVCAAEGGVCVGIAGTGFREADVGKDWSGASWGLLSSNGCALHRHAHYSSQLNFASASSHNACPP